MKTFTTSLLIALTAFLLGNCHKTTADPHIPPDMSLKTTAGYTFNDATISAGDSILVGVKVTKTEDDLKSFNVSYRYDGATTSTTFYNYVLSAAEASYYEKDIKLGSRTIAGTEVWLFSVVDRDGNLTQKTITLKVQ